MRGRRTGTFRDRLAVQTALLCLATLAVAGGLIFLGARAALQANVDAALLGIARAELASALDAPDGRVHIHEESGLVLRGAEGYEKIALIRDASGTLAAHTANVRRDRPPALDPEALARARAGAVVFGDLHLDGTALRAVYYPFHDRRGVAYTGVCAVPYAPMRQALRTLTATLGVVLLLSGAGALWGARRLARRLTDPLAEIARRTRGIGEASLHERLPALSPDEELRGVTDGVNAMLARLDTAFAEREASLAEREAMIARQRRFLMDASHELRTPVTNLRGTVEVALRRPRAPEAYREALETCRSETERLSVLVRDLLDLARGETGALALERSPVDLSALVCRAAQAHDASARERGVVLERRETAPATAWGDPTRLRQIVDNLVDNALRFAPEGSAVTLETGRDDGGVWVRVGDRGPGIAPEDLPHLFERFWRADRSRARATGGLGLGLAIARTLAEAHGGSLEARSVPGEGARFTLRVPAAPDA